MSLREKVENAIWRHVPQGEVGPEDCRKMAAAVMRALRPHEAVEDAEPLILYFPTKEDREEFIVAIHAAKPGMVSVRVD